MTSQQIRERLAQEPGKNPNFLCFFSTQWMGFTRDPQHFHVPVDDHGFHRGDGVFEAIRVVEGKPYLLKPHLDRLRNSAAQIGLKLPLGAEEIGELCLAGIRLTGEKDLILRLFVTRGPGGFSTSPRESRGSQFYLVVARFKGLSEETYAKGVRTGKSLIPSKPPFFAKVKSLNYLPNVLAKAEALERGLDYTFFTDPEGNLLESGTENLILINEGGELVHPPLENILHGCTMRRLFDLAEEKMKMKVVRGRTLREKDLYQAKEVFLIGTTLDVLPVVEYEGRALATGPLGAQLRTLLRADQRA